MKSIIYLRMEFKVVVEQDEDGFYVVTVPSLPGCISQGKTEKEALENVKEAIELHVSSLAEDGLPITPQKSKEKVKEVTVAVPL